MPRKIIIEIEVPEGKTLEDLLKGLNYRVLDDRVERLRRLFEEIERKGVKADRIPSREEIYADRTRY